MPANVSSSRLANLVARAICAGFANFHSAFHQISQRASDRFVRRDWHGLNADARQRLEVRDQVLRGLLQQLRGQLGDRLRSRTLWIGIKAVYSGLIQERDDWELAETFFNSVTRRIFTTVGLDTEIEFVHTDYATPPTPCRAPIYRDYQAETIAELVREVLTDHGELQLSAASIAQGAQQVAERIQAELPSLADTEPQVAAQFASAVFYRGEHAYLIGRATLGRLVVPLVLCLANDLQGTHVDAVLLEASDVSLLFSFTRSYFLVEVARPYDMVAFIQSLIPHKRVAEIYISLGYNKHGKTELYRHSLSHLATSQDKYRLADGQRGMVMVVFTMPSYPVVFKIIRDRFDFPKDCSRSSVIERYNLVFKHDRAGRLVDAQEYEYLVLDRKRFCQDLLEVLTRQASESVVVEKDRVVIKHCYAERRVTPLNIYLQQEDIEAQREAVVDYGRAIKDLALTNLFPGDLLPKNFGVTRTKRVVFYDYDEVCLLSECNFMKLPDTGNYDDDIAGEPWFGVGPNDIFPEEFMHFLGLPPDLKQLFIQQHGDLLSREYWNELKQRIVAGELFHVSPYAAERRLDRAPRSCALLPAPSDIRHSSLTSATAVR
jgi:isocitrate dehydrogenase kinase/phosphatase